MTRFCLLYLGGGPPKDDLPSWGLIAALASAIIVMIMLIIALQVIYAKMKVNGVDNDDTLNNLGSMSSSMKQQYFEQLPPNKRSRGANSKSSGGKMSAKMSAERKKERTKRKVSIVTDKSSRFGLLAHSIMVTPINEDTERVTTLPAGTQQWSQSTHTQQSLGGLQDEVQKMWEELQSKQTLKKGSLL